MTTQTMWKIIMMKQHQELTHNNKVLLCALQVVKECSTQKQCENFCKGSRKDTAICLLTVGIFETIIMTKSMNSVLRHTGQLTGQASSSVIVATSSSG